MKAAIAVLVTATRRLQAQAIEYGADDIAPKSVRSEQIGVANATDGSWWGRSFPRLDLQRVIRVLRRDERCCERQENVGGKQQQ